MDNRSDYDRVKSEIASELGINFNPHYNGNISAKDAGRLGGVIGGNMVKSMIIYAQEDLSKNFNK